MADANFRLGLYEGRLIWPKNTVFEPGTTPIAIGKIAANAILSTIFVNAMDAGSTVKVNFYDFGPGDGDEPGERIDLAGHPLIVEGDNPGSDRQVITRIGSKVHIEVVVTGGDVALGLQVEAIADFPAITDPKSYYKSYPGVADFADFVDVTTPGIEQTAYSSTVPAGSVRHMQAVRVVCRADCQFIILADGSFIGSGRTGPASPNANFTFTPFRPIAAGVTIEVKVTARADTAATAVEAYLQFSNEDV